MADLTYVDSNGAVVISSGATTEVDLKDIASSPAYRPYIFMLDMDDLGAGEQLTIRTYLDLGGVGGAHMLSEVVLVKGTDPPVYVAPPVPSLSARRIKWTMQPSGIGSNRNLAWWLLST